MITGFRASILAALCAASVAWAQAPLGQTAGGVPPELVQKQTFVRGLIEDQSVSDRIRSSQQAEAIRLLEMAQDNYSRANVALDEKNFAKAESQLNAAMSEIGKARRLVPDTAVLIAQQRADYAKTLISVESLQKSFVNYLRRIKLQPGATAAESESRVTLSINNYLNTADKFTKSGQWGNALNEAEKADHEMKYELGRILGLMAVNYIKTFDSPAEEYSYELERNGSLLELIPVVIAELRPSEEIRLTIDNLIEQDKAVIDLAAEYAKLRDYNKALINLNAGIGYLEVALTSAGLVMPQQIIQAK